jgi:DNA polymerase III epsilon subunit-like protein
MLVLGLDLETSDLKPETGKILELAYVLKRVGEPRPWKMRTEFIYEPSWGDDFVPREAQLINGIHPDQCKRFGVPLSGIAREINHIIKTHKVDAIVAHNGRSFDIPFLKFHISGLPVDDVDGILSVPLIDTMVDIEYPAHIKARNLVCLAAEHGFLNFQAHSALADVIATLRLLECYDVPAVFERSKLPSSIYQAMTDYHTKDAAKARGFRWQEIDGVTYPKCWVKRIRHCELEKEVALLGYPIKKLA